MKDLMDSGSLENRRRVLLSGLMRSQAGALREAMGRLGVRLIQEWDREMTWYTTPWGAGIVRQKGAVSGGSGAG